MADFLAPEVHQNTGWGPPACSEAPTLGTMGICNFVEHLEKFGPTYNRIGKACDFSASGQRYQQERGFKGKGKDGKGKLAPAVNKDDEGFSLVDNRPMPAKSQGRGRGGIAGRSKGRGKGIAINYQEGILGQKQRQMPQDLPGKGKQKGKGKGGQQRRQLPSFKEWSVVTRTEWVVMREIMLNTLAKLQLDAKEVVHEDHCWCGTLHNYNRGFDRITTKTERPMRRYEDLNFFNVTTSEDPILQEAIETDASVTVIATDHILACIIAAARSVYSWDIIVTKLGGKLIFDKRDGSQIDYLSVNETADQPPNNDDKDHINSPVKLGLEASVINQNFSQMVLDWEARVEQMERPNPFEEEDEGAAASGAYRYRKITLPGSKSGESDFEQSSVTMLVRTEVNCSLDGGQCFVKALNEYDPKPNNSWKQNLESQRGAVLATELKNNAFKLGRWTSQAILSGCDTMKIGYVSRQVANDPWMHTVLGVQTNRTDNFAEQIGLTRNNLFGILRAIIDQIMSWEDGKYVMVKDPTKSVMRLYQVPWSTFDDEGDGDEEPEEDDMDLDEDGNAVPQQIG